MSESLKDLSGRATPGEWHEDWFPTYCEDSGQELEPMCEGICVHTDRDEVESVLCCSEREAAFIVALVNAYRAGQLHDTTALSEARAEGRRQGLEEAADIAETEEAVRSTGGQSRPAHEAIRDLLPTAPDETQKPETGESKP